MRIAMNRMLRTRVVPEGEQMAAPLLGWLTLAEQERRQRRAILFMDLANRLETLEKKHNYPRVKLVRTSTYQPTLEQKANQQERVKLVRQLNRLIDKVVPNMKQRIDCQGGKWLRTSARRQKHVGFVYEYNVKGYEVVFDEANAFETMIQLAMAGVLGRVAQCRRCGRWLYRRKKHQTFCRFRCQQAAARQTPEYKLQRRNYMRRYRTH